MTNKEVQKMLRAFCKQQRQEISDTYGPRSHNPVARGMRMQITELERLIDGLNSKPEPRQ